MKSSLLLLAVWASILSLPLSAQVFDDFSDGDISNHLIWVGDTSKFRVNSRLELQSQGESKTDTIFLSTSFHQESEIEWRMYVRYGFAPSSSNFVRIYLQSDEQNLINTQAGYFVQIGESGSKDSYDLYRQDSSQVTKIIDGISGKAATGIEVLIRVVRDSLGNWTLSVDEEGDNSFELQGMVHDTTYTVGAHMGIWVKHSSTRNDAFFFDDVYAGPIIRDTIPPKLLSVNIENDSLLRLTFSEAVDSISAANVNHYSLLPGIGKPQSVIWLPGSPASVELLLPIPLLNGTTYTLTVDGISDVSGNIPSVPQHFEFEYVKLFSPAGKDVIINEIMADPIPSQGLPEVEYLELLNRSNKAFDLAGWTISNGSTVGVLPARIFRAGQYLILCSVADSAKFASFGEVICPDRWPTLVNGGDQLGLRSPDGFMLIDTVAYDAYWLNDEQKQDGGYSLELIYPDNLNCAGRTNWSASVNANGGTPGFSNSILSNRPEAQAPRLWQVSIQGDYHVGMCFNEPVDYTNTTGFLLNQGIGHPVDIFHDDETCIILDFGVKLETGVEYLLSISGIEDCNGNLIEPLTVDISKGRKAEPFEIIFSEIFADPTPQKQLPEAEFIEIYNRTNDVLDMSSFLLKRRNSLVPLGSGNLTPGQYAIICDKDVVADFSPYGKTIGVDNFPSLNNQNDTLFLLNPSVTRIDYVFYDKSWYREPDKSEGGWTLERVDPDFVNCNHPENWRASIDSKGGTPGIQNSVNGPFSDMESPVILSSQIIDGHILEIVFSTQMDEAALQLNANYLLDHHIGEPVLVLPAMPHLTSVQLTFDVSFEPNVLYELRCRNLSDCAGNTLETNLYFGIPLKPEQGDVLINEILFNPYTGGSDFVEIVNVSEKVLDLSDLQIGEIHPGTDSIYNADPISASSSLFLPGEIICLSRDVQHLVQSYLPPESAKFFEMRAFPSYDDDQGECVVLANAGVIMDRFYYEDDYHFPTLEDDEGVSLERISLRLPASDPSNWHSAASSVRFATPGYANSQMLEGSSAGNGEVYLEKQTFSPDLDGIDDVLAIHYDFDFVGANARLSVMDSHGRLIKTIAQNSLLGTEAGTFYWDGSDHKGTKADIGMYVVLFEVSNQQSGEHKAYRMVAVLAGRF